MSKYVDRIMDEVYDNFERHFNGDAEEITWFLEELIDKLEDELDSFKYFKQDIPLRLFVNKVIFI